VCVGLAPISDIQVQRSGPESGRSSAVSETDDTTIRTLTFNYRNSVCHSQTGYLPVVSILG